MVNERTPAYRTISDSIRNDILERRLVPGDRLPIENDLAERFGVSRSTVREALRELASQNLVETTRGATGGTFVVAPTTEALAQSLTVGIEMLAGSDDLTVDEMLEARELLELPAVRLATTRGKVDQLESIGAYIESRRVARPKGRDVVANWNFHTLIVQAANNPLLELMAQPIFYVLQNRFAQIRASASFTEKVDHDHQAIADAVLSGDADAAADAMLDHLEYLRPSYQGFDTRLGRQ